ncbi:hypothetical protein [Dechloromonas sp.]|uniref:hypothetical protein n=1 Tax=Dechloromonas sp. TaxID=1917218 RepID=UPI00286DDEA3|nr:hypothetical protein [Dechloromonas sp.]
MNKLNNRKLLLVVAAFLGGSVLADEHGHMHHKFPKDVDAFHSVLAPVWHARPGPERLQDACAKAGEMATLANEIRSRNASQLMASICVLKAKCDSDKGGVDAALFDVHEAFHHLINMRSDSPKR